MNVLPTATKSNVRPISPTPSIWNQLRENYAIVPKVQSSSSPVPSSQSTALQSPPLRDHVRLPLQQAPADPGSDDESATSPKSSTDLAKQAVRQELLKSRFHKSMSYSDLTLKHFYGVGNGNLDTTGATTALSGIVQMSTAPTTMDERIGNQVRLIRLKIRFCANMVQGLAATIPVQVPNFRLSIWRAYIPDQAAGVVVIPTYITTDANPPADSGALMSRLGLANTGYALAQATRNPITSALYHVYYDEFHLMNPKGSSAGTVNTQIIAPQVFYREFDIDLKGIIADFSGAAANTQLTNLLLLSVIGGDATNQGWQMGYHFSTDLVFADVSQTDGRN